MLLSAKELAKLLKVHLNSVYNWTKEGMPHYRVGKSLRFKIDEVETWMKVR